MTVACPAPAWPAALRKAGPPEDGTILLRGQAMIGDARFVVTAVRVNPVRYGPDFRADRDLAIYAGYELSELLDMIAELVGVAEASTVELPSGQYVMWMLPGGDER
jgi:hypothetical protein